MLENVNLDWIKTFVYFVDNDGVDHAAKKLGISQPAVTQHLNKLEANLPKKLFERQGKRKALTKFGNDFYKDASSHLRSIDVLLRNSKYMHTNEEDVVLRIGLNRDIYFRICDKISFKGQIAIFPQKSEDALQSLIKRDVDLAVARRAPESSDVIAVKWFSDSYVLVYPKTWAREVESKGLKEVLRNKHFILNSESENQTLEALQSLNISITELTIKNIIRDWLSFVKLAERHYGWGILPSSYEIPSNLISIPLNIKSLPKTQFYVLYHRSVRNYPGFQDLLQSILNSMR